MAEEVHFEDYIRQFPAGARLRTVQPEIGILNFRDLGGLVSGDGRVIRRGMIFRSTELYAASPDTMAKLCGMGIKTVCDLRSAREKALRKEVLPEQMKYVDIVVEGRSYDEHPVLKKLVLKASCLENMELAYYDSIRDCGPEYGRLIQLCANQGNLPMLIHCVQGKDRTGIAVGLLLLALGIPRETIIAEYTLSNAAGEALWERETKNSRSSGVPLNQEEKLLCAAKAEWLDLALNEIDERFGGLDRYLREQCGITNETLAVIAERLLIPMQEYDETTSVKPG